MNTTYYQKDFAVKIRNLLQFTLSLLIAIGLPIAAKATHIVGGEITYRCLGNNQYEITLKVYRDCINGREDFDRPAYIGVYDYTGALIQNVNIPFNFVRDTLNPTLDDPCLVLPGNVCVDTATYRKVVTLADNPAGGGYRFTYVRCCRNKIIDNIVRPEEAGAAYDIELSIPAMEMCNSSPTFPKLPPTFLCVGRPFVFDHSAVETDGDSLVYSLCTPLSAGSVTNPKPIPTFNPTNNAPPFDEIEWLSGFGLDNLFGAGAPLTIDPVTGLLTATPGIQGTFVVGICVTEYDRETGMMLSTVRRDYQFDIGICGEVVSADCTFEDTCSLTLDFQNNSTDADDFIWYFDYPNTNLTSTETSPSFTFPAPGTYTVALIAEPGAACTDTAFMEINVRDNTINLDYDVGVVDCETTSVLRLQDLSTDAGSPIVSSNWTVTYGDLVTLNFSAQDTVIELPFGVSGTVQLIVTNADSCSKSETRNFQTGTNPIPIEVIRDTIFACEGDLIALNPDGDPNDGFVYNWTPANLLNNPNAVNPTFIATQTTTFTVQIAPTEPFCEATKNVVVIVSPALSIDLGADQMLCLGDTLRLNPIVMGGRAPYTYAWSGGLPATPTQQLRPLLPNTYIVTVTDANGCSASDTVEVDIKVVPAVIALTDKIGICQGDTATLNAIVNGGTQPYIFVWDQGLDSVQTQLVTPQATTTYRVRVFTTDGCSATDSVIVNVDPIPPLNIVNIECATDNQTYSVDFTTTTDSLTTTVGTIVQNGPGSFTITGIPNGQEVTITATFFSSGCTRSVTLRETCDDCPDLDPPISNGDTTICQNEPIPTLSVMVNPGETVDWYDAPFGGNLLLSNSLSFTPATAGTYYTETRVDTCTSNLRTPVTLTINPTPAVQIVASDSMLCLGESATLTANVQGGTEPYTYVWDNGLPNAPMHTVTPTQTTTYNVTVTDVNGCSNTNLTPITIIVNPLPEVEASASDSTICEGESVTLNAAATGATPFTFAWSNGVNGESQSVNPTQRTTYVVTVTDGNGCMNADSVTINVNPRPEASILSDKGSICLGDSATITTSATDGTPPYTFNWDNGITGTPQVVRPTETTTYSVTVTDANMCMDTASVIVTVTPGLDVTISASAGDTVLCEGESAMLTASSANGIEPFIYVWSTGATSETIEVSEAGEYAVTVTDATGCSGQDTITIIVNPLPEVEASASDSTICEGESVTLNAAATGATPFTFAWSNGVNGESQSVNPTQTTTYVVTVTDGNGCMNADSVTINVNPRPEASILSDKGSICLGDSATITTSATDGTPPYTFNWDNGITGTPQVVRPTETTTYSVTVTDANMCMDTASVTVTVTPGLDVTISASAGDTVLCEGESAMLTASSANGVEPFTYMWSTGETSETIEVSEAGEYAVTVTDATGCSGQDTITIIVNPLPEVEASASDSTICEGESVTLNAAATGATPLTFAWSNGVNGESQSVNPTQTTTYVVTVTDGNGCMNADSVTINVNPRPEASILSDKGSICLGDSATITTSATDGTPPYTFNWDNGITGTPQVVRPTETTTYSVTVTDANMCMDTASVTVMVTPGLDVTISASAGDTVLCEGESAMLTASSANGVEPFTYMWSTGETSETIEVSEAGEYAVTVTDATGCSGQDTITIIVNPNPEVEASASDSTICEGESVTLNAAATGATPFTFAWSNGVNGQSQSVNPTQTTTYVVTVTDGNGCMNADSVTINVNPRPEASILSDKGSICLGDSATITTSATDGTPPYTFNWDNGITGTPQVVRPTETTTYSVTVTDANMCMDTASVTVTVNPALMVTISADDESICEGDSATLTANVGNGVAPYNYLWNTGEQTMSITVFEAGDYAVTVTDATGCFGQATITITVTQPPMPDITADLQRDTICPGEMVTLTASSTGGTGNITYSWNNNFNGAQQVVTPFQDTTFIVTATDENGCTGVDSIRINVYPIINAEAMITSPRDTICPGETVKLRASATGGEEPFTFAWNNGLGAGDEKEVSPTQTTTYMVTVTDANMCTAVASVTVVVAPVNATVPTETIVCLPTDDAMLSVTNLDPNQTLTYQWSPTNAILTDPTLQTVTVDPNISNTFTVIVTNQFGCKDTLEGSTNILNLPLLINATVTPDTINNGETAQLNLSGCPNCNTFSWTSNPLDNSISNPNIANPTVSPEETTTYTVNVAQGICTAQDTVTLFVRNCDPVVFLPNAFTPNGDGINDIWRIRSNSINLLKPEAGGSTYLVVYNRWGQKVFETRDPEVGWNGKFNNTGAQLPPDAYGWIVQTVCPTGQRYEAQGNVTLLR
ncbi:MAG: gliding motility-associated C-terminal domain-containing protein [Saprospiraceae bacterium]|nr:gliding motility-associated C-terminal domain-containing protein [Saprospiraceae bacterium]